MAEIISILDIEEAKKKIRKINSFPIVLQAQDSNFNRKMLDFGQFHVLLGLEKNGRSNKLRHVDIEFNEVLAKLAHENNIAIGLDLEEIKKVSSSEKIDYLLRIIFIIHLCRKKKVKLAFSSSLNLVNTQGLLRVLGASNNQIKEALVF